MPIDEIRPSKLWVRKVVDESSLAELCSSIGRHGIIEPIVVRPIDGCYEVVAGTRRFLAARQLGLKTLPVCIRKLSDHEVFQVFMAENLNREGFAPLEIGVFLRRALKEFGWSQRQLAKNLGRDPAWVSRHLRLLNLPAPIQSMLTRVNGGLTEGHARHIFGLNRTDLIRVANTVATKNLTVRQTQLLVRRMKAESSKANGTTAHGHRMHVDSKINDLAPEKWREYFRDYYFQVYSVWTITRRHDPFFGIPGTVYAGTFPMIVPINCILRYTKKSEVVLDPFVGSATTLQASAMLKRRGIGVDINPDAEKAKEKRFQLLSEKAPSLGGWLKRQKFVRGDSRNLSFIPDCYVDLIITHPPYADMMPYGDKGSYTDVEEWKNFLRDSYAEMMRVLKPGRFCCIQVAPYVARRLPLHHMAFELALEAQFEFIE